MELENIGFVEMKNLGFLPFQIRLCQRQKVNNLCDLIAANHSWRIIPEVFHYPAYAFLAVPSIEPHCNKMVLVEAVLFPQFPQCIVKSHSLCLVERRHFSNNHCRDHRILVLGEISRKVSYALLVSEQKSLSAFILQLHRLVAYPLESCKCFISVDSIRLGHSGSHV